MQVAGMLFLHILVRLLLAFRKAHDQTKIIIYVLHKLAVNGCVGVLLTSLRFYYLMLGEV
jgi:hypothetical protein